MELVNLLATTVYTVKVTAINRLEKESSGSGKQGVAFETVIATPPSTPWGLLMISCTGGSIEMSWNPPANTGGMPLDGMIYNVTMFPLETCYRLNGVEDGDHCGSCNLIKLQGGKDYEYASSGYSSCERPATSICADGTSSCCMTRGNSSYGSGLQCSRIEPRAGRYRLVVSSNATVFQSLNHSTAYVFDVRANNLVGSSSLSEKMSFSSGYFRWSTCCIRFLSVGKCRPNLCND